MRVAWCRTVLCLAALAVSDLAGVGTVAAIANIRN